MIYCLKKDDIIDRFAIVPPDKPFQKTASPMKQYLKK